MELIEWMRNNETLLALMAVSGFLLFIGSLIAIPVIVAYMPEDYFVRMQRPFSRSPLRSVLHILKNFLGAGLFLAGLMMLVLPGQGILTMVIGLSLIDFPGKHRLQMRLVRVPRIRRSIQWIRQKVHHQPLQFP